MRKQHLMKDNRTAIDYIEGRRLLFGSTYKVCSFNIFSAALLTIYLSGTDVPSIKIYSWFTVMFVINVIRLIHCKLVISKDWFKGSFKLNLKLFLTLSVLTGITWSAIYFISVPYTQDYQRYIMIFIFAGLTAGATSSLGAHFNSFLAFTLPTLIPIIIYNYYVMEVTTIIVATLIVMFLMGIIFVTKSHQELFRRIFLLTEQNENLRNKFEKLSITDALTGLYNRRHFTKIIKKEYSKSKHSQESFVLISIDVDNFKLINDNFGHAFGDKFLVYVANYLMHYSQHSHATIFRLGGDEFAALLINPTEEQTKNICEAIKNNFLKDPSFNYASRNNAHQIILDQISLCLGVMYVPPESTFGIKQIIEKVDELLYQAKQEGKNQIKYIRCI